MNSEQEHTGENAHGQHEKPHEIHYEIDGEHQTTTERELTPTQIMSDAGIDPQTNYLVQLIGEHEKISYEGKPTEEIEMKDGMRFIAKPIGPMPVS